MEITSASSATQVPAAVDDSTPVETEETKDDSNGSTGVTSTTGSDFTAFFTKALGKSGSAEVNEEELFAAVIQQRLSKDNKEAADFYGTEKTRMVATGMSCEDAGKAALKSTVASGKLKLEDAEKVHAFAFKAAQLDSNIDELWDGTGGTPDDPTKAVAAMEQALLNIQAMSDEFEKGAVTLAPRSLDTPSNTVASSLAKLGGGVGGGSGGGTIVGDGKDQVGNASDGHDGFLWKPVSDSNGKLAVLLPKSLAGMIEKVEIHSSLPPSPDNLLGTGKFSANANGGRDHYRFSKPGADYGDNVYVVAYKNGGGMVTYAISDGSKRID